MNFKYLLLSSCLSGIFTFSVFAEGISGLPGSRQPAGDSLAQWQPAGFTIETSGYTTFEAADLGHPFAGSRNCIVRIAPEIDGLTGIQQPAGQPAATLKLKFPAPVQLLIGVPGYDDLPGIVDKPQARLVLDSGLTITGLPPVKVFAVPYGAGTHEIYPGSIDSHFIIGIVNAEQRLTPRNAQLPDGNLWRPFIVDGYSDGEPLFEIMGGPAGPVIDQGMPGTTDIQGGFEGGTCVKVGDTYHLFPTERAGEKGVDAYHDRVKTRIGHWTSSDAVHWERESTIFASSGNYALTVEDNPMNDRRAAIWSYNAVFNEAADRWYGYYLTYTVDRDIDPNHSFGRIWLTKSKTKGINGIGGPYDAGRIIMEPGLDSQLWEGRQGVASFYPFPVDSTWLAFYAGAYPFATWADYPRNGERGKWYVGLARAASMDGPWTRLDTSVNPVQEIHPEFVENPLVYKMPGGEYIAIFDGGPDTWGLHLPNMIAYTVSKDGLHWSEARYLPIHTKVKKWWDIMRTPLCLIPEGNDVYTILYAAINEEKRFHPIGKVSVKLNQDVLREMVNRIVQ